MDTKSRLENDLKTAMRNNDDLRKRTIRMALAAIRLAQVEKGSPVDEDAVLSILQKEVKSRRETIQDAQKAFRPDLVTAAEQEMAVLDEYLPKQLSSQELDSMAIDAIQEVGAKTPADMGKVMKVLLPKIQGRAPGGEVSLAVRRQLEKQ
jgi:uncharacterized protein YqeY